ncbi:hypothetical protein J6590_075976 [Homalodisca vitripennis]|nr:hypothetical protein J6590_075976 [Homalodisca vitripennis]
MDEVLLEETNFTKFLRVCLDRGLIWDEHIVCVPEEAARRRSPQICFSGISFNPFAILLALSRARRKTEQEIHSETTQGIRLTVTPRVTHLDLFYRALCSPTGGGRNRSTESTLTSSTVVKLCQSHQGIYVLLVWCDMRYMSKLSHFNFLHFKMIRDRQEVGPCHGVFEIFETAAEDTASLTKTTCSSISVGPCHGEFGILDTAAEDTASLTKTTCSSISVGPCHGEFGILDTAAEDTASLTKTTWSRNSVGPCLGVFGILETAAEDINGLDIEICEEKLGVHSQRLTSAAHIWPA